MNGAGREAGEARVAAFSLAQAESAASQRNFIRAFPHFLVFAQLEKEKFVADHIPAFLSVTRGLAGQLGPGRAEKVEAVYREALQLLPACPHLLTDFGSLLFRSDRLDEAERCYRAAITADPRSLPARDRLENLCAARLDRWHFPMLNHTERNTKYEGAIQRAVAAGRVAVLDIGSGTGLLSLMAARAGALTVTACEASEAMVDTARAVLASNPTGSIVHLVPKLSLDLTCPADMPAKADLCVTETFDSGLLGEHVLESLCDAWRRLLAPGCQVIPARAEFVAAPLECDHVRAGHRAAAVPFGQLARPGRAARTTSWQPYTTEPLATVPGGYRLLAQPATLFSVNFEDPQMMEQLLAGRVVELEWRADRAGEWDAVAGWFRLHLDKEAAVENGPNSGQSGWQQAVFPVGRKVAAGARLSAQFTVRKHVQMDSVKVTRERKIEEVVTREAGGEKREVEDVELAEPLVRLLNCPIWQTCCQRVARYAARDLPYLTSVLDLSRQPAGLALQLLALLPAARLTQLVDPIEPAASRNLLDWTAGLAEANQLDLARLDCVTEACEAGLVLTAPVQQCGRLDSEVLQQLETLGAEPDCRLLPATLELWCSLADSPSLAAGSRLISDQAVLGFSVAEHVNRLAVVHQQEVCLAGTPHTALAAPARLAVLNLTSLDLARSELITRVEVTSPGTANCIFYWFVLDYGWDVQLDTLQSKASHSFPIPFHFHT